MRLPEPLIEGKLIHRYKRFLVDVELPDGSQITAHCPNPGSMKGLTPERGSILLSESSNPKRRLPFTWELVEVCNNWVCVNTGNANRLVKEALTSQAVPELAEYDKVKAEVRWSRNCRFDFLLTNAQTRCFLEVKSVTMAIGNVALFPDSVTLRGTKHLNHLVEVVAKGHRAVLFFLVNRGDCQCFRSAAQIDQVYAETLGRALKKGVEILVYRTEIVPPDILLDCPLEFEI